MAERGHFVDEQQGTQAARPIERAQRRHDHEAQPDAMRPHPFGGQDHIDRRGRGSFSFRKSTPCFFFRSSRIGGESIQRVCVSAVERTLASSFVCSVKRAARLAIS